MIAALRGGEWHNWILISERPLALAALWGGDHRVAKVDTGRPVMWLLWLSNDEGHCGGDKDTIWGHILK